MKWVSLSFDFFIWKVASGVSQDDQAEATSAMAGPAQFSFSERKLSPPEGEQLT